MAFTITKGFAPHWIVVLKSRWRENGLHLQLLLCILASAHGMNSLLVKWQKGLSILKCLTSWLCRSPSTQLWVEDWSSSRGNVPPYRGLLQELCKNNMCKGALWIGKHIPTGGHICTCTDYGSAPLVCTSS